MSDHRDDDDTLDNPPATSGGRRKDGQPYKDGNTREDGSYVIGKNRTPVSTRFAPGDGRKRGRRAKGVRNADTEFEEEYNRKVTITEGGKQRKVTKGRAAQIRLLDNGYAKGQTAAIVEIDRRQQRLAEKRAANQQRTAESDAALLDAYIQELLGQQAAGPHLLSDPVDGAVVDPGADRDASLPADEGQDDGD